jgi:hypothetical protein
MILGHMRVTRYYAENKIKSGSIDVAEIDTTEGVTQMSYDIFEQLFQVALKKGEEQAFAVTCVAIKDEECMVPR